MGKLIFTELPANCQIHGASKGDAAICLGWMAMRHPMEATICLSILIVVIVVSVTVTQQIVKPIVDKIKEYLKNP